MTKFGWRDAVKLAVWRSDVRGDEQLLDMLVDLLIEQEMAKRELYAHGFGTVDAGWIEVVSDVLDVGR